MAWGTRAEMRWGRVKGGGGMHLQPHSGFKARDMESVNRAAPPAAPPPASMAAGLAHLLSHLRRSSVLAICDAGERRAAVGVGLGSFGEQGAA